MEKKPCPICSRLNDPLETHCWFCHAELTPVSADQPHSSDWIDGLRQDEDTSSDNNPVPPVESTSSDETEKPEEYVPDWLSRIRSKEATERAEKKAEEDKYWAEKQSRSGVPDWLHSLNEETSTPKTEGEAQHAPQDLYKDSSDAPSGEESSVTPANNEDWLESLKSWQSDDATEKIIQPETSEVAESPAEIENSPQSELQEDPEVLPEPEFDLEKIFSPLIEEPVIRPEKPAETPEVVLPAGFEPFDITFDETEIQAPISQPEQVDLETTSTVESDNDLNPEFESIPDSRDEVIETQPSEDGLPISQEPVTNVSAAQVPDQFGLDFLNDQSDVVQPQPDIQDEFDEIIEEVSAEEVAIETPVSPFKADDFFLESLAPDDLPEWLTDVKPIEKPVKEKPSRVAPEADDGSSKPEKGNLPVWLAAFRPVEAVEMAAMPEEKTNAGETPVGDQAANLVSGISAATFGGKPSDLGGGLKVSNRQQTNAALLSLIASNAETVEESEKSLMVGTDRTLWRSLLALVFIVVALLGGTVLNGYGLQPALFPGEVVHTFDRINSIPADKTVLISGDFEAGFAGEIRLTSQALIEHIMRRNLNIALMSINPVDSALLVDQIQRGSAFVPSYQTVEKVVDLGYFPGGAIAVHDLGNSFSNTVPLTADRVATSSQELLKGIQNMADFGAIIVITDKAETARVWIEQLQPTLGDTPLLMVTSAQASPLIQPYYQSGQVSGMVSGLSGGLVYERIMGSTGEAGRNHTSLQLLSVLMAALVLGGGFISLVKPGSSGGKRQ
jgi:hypothetical protein